MNRDAATGGMRAATPGSGSVGSRGATGPRFPRPSRWSFLGEPAVWILFGLALAERLACLIGSNDHTWPFSIFYEGDAEAFYNYAQAMIAGRPYDNGIPFHPPLFPALLSVLHRLIGSPVSHELLRSILGTLSAVVPPALYIGLRGAIGRGAALAAALLATFSFGLDILGVSATSEGLYLFLALALLGVALSEALPGRPGIARGAALGLLTGLLGLARAEGLAVGFFVLAVWIGPSLRAAPRRFAPATIAWLIGLLVALAPSTIRNAEALSDWNARTGQALGAHIPTFAPITSYGPLNFALANNAQATGGFQRSLLTSREHEAVLDLADPQHRHYFLNGTQEGLRWITGHPGAFLSLAGRKLGIITRALDLGWSPWNFPLGRTGTRRPVDLFAPDASGLRFVQLFALGAGIWLLIRGRKTRTLLLLACPIAGALLAGSLFFGYVRLGAVVLPFAFALEGVAIAHVAGRFPERLRVRLGRGMVPRVLAATALALLIFAMAQDRNYNASGSSQRPGGQLIRDAEMKIAPLND